MATLFVDNLTVADFSYLDAKRGMVGESLIVDLVLDGDLDDQGMVFDFGHVKRDIKRLIDEDVDHRLLVPGISPNGNIHNKNGELHLEWQYPAGTLRMTAPQSSILVLEYAHVDINSIRQYLEQRISELLPANVKNVTLTLRSEDLGTAPFYQYSHGLKKHDGNCQRIAHGHRSAIKIYENGRRSRYWEKLWADRWSDIYIATREDLEGEYDIDGVTHHRYQYQASQGSFELLLPAASCYVIDTDSTVEHLAAHMADQLALEAPGKAFRVRAYEGVGKGAIAEAGANEPAKISKSWLTS